jgi:hypothetical protein
MANQPPRRLPGREVRPRREGRAHELPPVTDVDFAALKKHTPMPQIFVAIALFGFLNRLISPWHQVSVRA